MMKEARVAGTSPTTRARSCASVRSGVDAMIAIKSVSLVLQPDARRKQVYLRASRRIYTFVNGGRSMPHRRPGLQGMHDEAGDSCRRRSRPFGGTCGGA